jgi:hypothetical protein
MGNLYSKLQQIIEEFENKSSLFITPELHDLIQFQNIQDDETQLKMALRQFLSDRDDQNNSSKYRFKFATKPLDLFCIRIAEEIAEENEPIIFLIKESLDPKIQYMDESFFPVNLQNFTEYTDDKGKRRLKDLTQFGLSDDSKRIISYLRSCEVAIADEKTGFCDQTEQRRPLT